MNPVAGLDRTEERIILFDGLCNLCNGSVQFIIRLDPGARFRFATLRSPFARKLLADIKIDPEDLDTVVYVDGGRIRLRSSAALHILKDLGGPWSLCRILLIIPRPLRDALYRWVAAHRYRWFGKRATCMVPSAELSSRFLGGSDQG